MEEKDVSFELRSEEVQEILSRVPHWLIRWGSLVVLMILGIMVLVSWFVKYPDVISAPIIITTTIPPQKLVSKSSGKIEAILVKDKELISKNTPLAVIENAANYKDVFLLKEILDTIRLEKAAFPFSRIKFAQLGEVESVYAEFQKEYLTNQLNQKLQPYKVEGAAQTYEGIQLKERLSLLESQKSISESELLLQKSDLERYETLYKKGIIALQELEKHRLVYLQTDKSYKTLLSNVSQLKSSLNDLKKNNQTTLINEDKEQVNLERNVIQAFYHLKKAIKDWELNYVLRSAIDGRVTFLQVWTENQMVAPGDHVFSVIPIECSDYIGKIKAKAQNSGKIKKGEKVNIRLANYPDREFGVIKGVVNTLSLTPDKEGDLLIDVRLSNGLNTSYHKQVKFQQEMSGTAEIITQDQCLLQRILYQFKGFFSR
ncbi:HlyD family efflux transporter periplasmic adaptor subunit [Flavobacterium sp. SUN046]|uniref:HlyD family secretion protein n=1 Tax=Flavobacterium sp. SUN046 TaxID=3002440 RepID=UPI002DB5CF96|nr:HlyD family efflux transporter periplasmic adaptor subunit [Flavobacterium sp. SUN046]MEC4047847.1 HlyD family efflux transporter periplasmic adaptor subunit [Flavobacterium sp. SUN046]